MSAIVNPPSLNVGGCDDCSWEPNRGFNLTTTRKACQMHAKRMHHATFVIVEQVTNYDERPQRTVVDVKPDPPRLKAGDLPGWTYREAME